MLVDDVCSWPSKKELENQNNKSYGQFIAEKEPFTSRHLSRPN